MFTKRASVAAIVVACATLTVWFGWRRAQPVILVDALSDRLHCISYAPYRQPGQTPFDPIYSVPPEQIEADLALLGQRFSCVRIYSVSRGLGEVPRIAGRHGLKVLLGIWIGRNPKDNDRELQRGLALANAHRDAIEAVIVGNEVLLRGDQPAAVLKGYIERAKSALPGIPITYADVWEFWLQHRVLKDAVDFVTIHILPYWEDRPIRIEDAVGHVSHIYQHVKRELADKTIMIGESGWPSRGRQRQGAVPSLVNQARFIREFAVRADLEHIPYNVIEAFDQPWKRILEGAVGGYWGLYDAGAAVKFPFRGPVPEAPQWWYMSAGVGLVLFAASLRRWRTLSGAGECLALGLISVAAGGAYYQACWEMWTANRTSTEWLLTGVYAVLLVPLVLQIGAALAAWWARGVQPPAVPPTSYLLRWIRRNDQSHDGAARWLGVLRLAFLFGAAFACLVLFFDPRYRDFPTAMYAVPAVGYALLAWIEERTNADVEEIVLAVIIATFASLIAISEHLTTPRDMAWAWAESVNLSALAWTATCLLLAGSVLLPVIVELRARQRQYAEQKSHG